jgi:serine-type D-Ala-D-Ala carboxypeptidase/endopeptidase
MAVRGEVALEDPVDKLLPRRVKMPARGRKRIALLDLATYTSGLPRMPFNFRPKDKDDPYSNYTISQLYEFLSGYTLNVDPGSNYEYYNLGFGLLGHALALRAGRSCEDLLVEKILRTARHAKHAHQSHGVDARTPGDGHDASLQPTTSSSFWPQFCPLSPMARFGAPRVCC